MFRARARAITRKPKTRRYEKLETRLENWLIDQNRREINGTILREKAKFVSIDFYLIFL